MRFGCHEASLANGPANAVATCLGNSLKMARWDYAN